MTCAKCYNNGVYHQSLSLNWRVCFGFFPSFLFIKVFKVFFFALWLDKYLNNISFLVRVGKSRFRFLCKVHLNPLKRLPFRWASFLLCAIIRNAMKRNFCQHKTKQTKLRQQWWTLNSNIAPWYFLVPDLFCPFEGNVHEKFSQIIFSPCYANTVEILLHE